MIQRLLFRALERGIAILTETPDMVGDLFRTEYGLPEGEVEGIQTLFEEQTPKVIFGYSGPDAVYPIYSVVMPAERESVKYIGDDPGMIEDPEDIQFGTEQVGSIWSHQYDILVMSRHPDATAYYYEIAKQILVTARDYFIEAGAFDMQLSGTDLAPDPRYQPEFVFVRRLSFQCSREFQRPIADSQFGKAFKVAGIFVDSDGSRSDPGDVKTLVSTYVPETEE